MGNITIGGSYNSDNIKNREDQHVKDILRREERRARDVLKNY